MSSWSQHRKLTYASIIAAVVLIAVGVPAFYLFYTPATCFDGKQNQNEQGIDCGGKCQKLCQSSFLSPSVPWTGFTEFTPGVYSLAAYIVNPNSTGIASNVPYHMIVYDSKGRKITDQPGTVTIPPNRNTLAIIGSVSVGKSVPYRVLFEFMAAPDWRKAADTLSALQVLDKKYTEDSTGSSLLVALKNSSADPIYHVTVYAALYDQDHNNIGFSKTIVDSIPPFGTASAPFTWPINRQGKVISIEVLPVAQ